MEKFDKEKGHINLLLTFVVGASLFLFFFQSFSITGNATEGSTTSNVTISKFLAINMGANLSEGIQFGTVALLPAQNVNASHDYDGAGSNTTYSIEVHNDSNTAVDFCIKANAGLTSSGLDVIGIDNESYSSFSHTNSTYPLLSNESSMTTDYIKAVGSITPGDFSYWRFWLDVPAAQPSGDYNNSVLFEGVSAGLAC
ncbi:MAG: hypothetical protein NUV46_04375 [Nanoarchaeota archaeon]|nr:hypothetical protein [Nanoarchaeota archaeon]